MSSAVAARNEGEAVEEAMGSALVQSYQDHLKIVAVDDRSTDSTTAILAGLASGRADVMRVIRVEELPEGWLGKNHALYLGAEEAGGDWPLFTDGAVRFSPECLGEVVNHAVRGASTI